MNLGQQVQYLRKVRGYTQEELCKKARVGLRLYKQFESGETRMNERYLHNVLIVLEGSLAVVPFRYKHHKQEAKTSYKNNYVSPGGVSMWDALNHVRKLFKEMPNLLMRDEVALQAPVGFELFMKGEIGKINLKSYRDACYQRYQHYNEIENGHKISGVEKKTISLEMKVMEILAKMCHMKKFHEVPKLVQELLRED